MTTLILLNIIRELKASYGGEKTLKEIEREIEDNYYFNKKLSNK